MKIRIRNAVLFALALSISSSVFAVARGFYVGTAFGQSNLHNKTQVFQTGDDSPPVTATASNTGLALRWFFFGYNYNPYAAVEMGFDHFASTTYGGVPTSVAVNTPSIHEYGFDIAGKGILPVGNFDVFGKAGFAYVRKSASGSLASCDSASVASATNPFPCSSTSSVNSSTQANAFRPLVGVGVSYDASQNWVIGFSGVEIIKGGGIQGISLYTLEFAYHIVDEYCGQFLC